MSSETRSYPFDIVGRRALWFTISGILILLGLGKMAYSGQGAGHALNFGIDFTGGAAYVFKFDELPGDDAASVIAAVRPVVAEAGAPNAAIQVFRAGDEIQIRTATGSEEDAVATAMGRANEEAEALRSALSAEFGEVSLVQSELVGPVIGEYLRSRGTLALAIGCVFILLYVWVRYNIGGLGGGYLFGLCAVVALLHDLLLMLSVYAWTRTEVDTSFVAAVLTVVGYSVNDTVIIFDRIRENLRRLDVLQRRNLDVLADTLNVSVWQTMARSVVTLVTTLFPLVTLFIFGGVSIRNFAFALMVGIFFGGYSSIFIAAPLLMWMNRRAMSKAEATAPPAARPRRQTAAQAPAAPKAESAPAKTDEATEGDEAPSSRARQRQRRGKKRRY